MHIHEIAAQFPTAARTAANHLFKCPDDTIVIFIDPDNPGIHVIDAESIATEPNLPMISPVSILFCGTKAVMDTLAIAAIAAAY